MFVLWYRKDLLDKAGLKVPKTVEELIQVGKTLNTGGTQGFAIGLTRAGNARWASRSGCYRCCGRRAATSSMTRVSQRSPGPPASAPSRFSWTL